MRSGEKNYADKRRPSALLRACGRGMLDFVLPPRCPVSGDIVDAPGVLTAASWERLRFIADPFCACCGVPFGFDVGAATATATATLCVPCLGDRPPFRAARAALAYDEESRGLILSFKHGDQTQLTQSFIPWLRRAGRDFLVPDAVLVPVPLHRGRLWKRRYNQAGLLAAALARETGLPWLPHSLRRVRATKPQGSGKARAANVRNAFAVPDKERAALAGRAVILVDDVFTTGATAVECTRTLLRAGAASVDVLTIARVVRD